MTTATCHRTDHAVYCDRVAAEAARFKDIARELEPSARVPTCPDWSAADLMRHVGTVHRWCAAMVEVLSPRRFSSADVKLERSDEPEALPDWLAASGETVVRTLRAAADPEAPMWSWGSDRHVRFWSRRMLHETAVHRADAEFTAGRDPVIDAATAVDGVDEFLDNLPFAVFAPGVRELRGSGESIAIRCTDANTVWRITLEPDRFRWDHGDDETAVTVEGAASDLVLFVYGRHKPDDTGRFKVTGDKALLEFWCERSSI